MMVKSMTGFGRSMSIEEDANNFTVEIKSVNHRYLDFNIRMPRSLMALENKVREAVKDRINRGKIDIFINQNVYGKEDVNVKFNEVLADNYLNVLETIKNKYSVNNDISVSLIAKFPEVVSLEKKEEDLEEIWINLNKALIEASESLVNMRKAEGRKLLEDILSNSNKIKELLYNIEKKAPFVVEDYKNKLENRLKELLEKGTIDEARVSVEVAIFADKAAIDEEIIRLHSHLNQLKETLDINEPVGRKLDFIVQEMNREANTMASKSSDLEIINSTINIKNYIEKIREQIQNIE